MTRVDWEENKIAQFWTKECWDAGNNVGGCLKKKYDGNVENAFWVSGRKCRSELYGKNGDVFPSVPLWC